MLQLVGQDGRIELPAYLRSYYSAYAAATSDRNLGDLDKCLLSLVERQQ